MQEQAAAESNPAGVTSLSAQPAQTSLEGVELEFTDAKSVSDATPRPMTSTTTKTQAEETDALTSDSQDYDTNHLIDGYTISGKGLTGCLERVPILVKLAVLNGMWFLVVLACFIAGIIIRVQDLNHGIQQRTFNRFCVATGTLIHNLQNERAMTFLYMSLKNGTLSDEDACVATELIEEQLDVDASINEFQDFLQTESLDNIIDTQISEQNEVRQQPFTETEIQGLRNKIYSALDDVKQALREITYIRKKAQQSTASKDIDVIYNFYSEWILSMLTIICSARGKFDSYALILMDMEFLAQERALGAVLVSTGTIQELMLQRYIAIRQKEEVLDKMVTSILYSDYFFNTLSKQPLEPVSAYFRTRKYLTTVKPGATVDVRWQDWWRNGTEVFSRYMSVEGFLAGELLDEKDIRSSVAVIVIVTLTLILASIVTAIASLIISRTIILPWLRMNRLQEETISKFVPRGFLKLIGAKQIVDIKMGTAVQERLTMLFSDIRDFTTISENMTPSQSFEFINSYLNVVGPVIRKFGGYIDKYLGDGFIALFKHAKFAMMAAVEMQQKVEIFAKTEAKKYTQAEIRVGIGLHSGDVIVGTLGENRRMDGSVIGDAVNLTARLESLTKRYGVKILTSISSIQQMKGASAQMSFRFMGKVRVKGKLQEVEIYEVLDGSDKLKELSKERFNTAVSWMLQNRFEEAKDTLQQIAEENPNDKPARLKLEQCMHLMKQGEAWEGIEIIHEK